MKFFLSIIILLLCFNNFAQNGASTPGVADNNPISIPYHKSNHTTVSNGNNVQDPGGIVDVYTSGNDYFYYYCPTTSGDITISLAYLSTSTGVSPHISVWKVDPSTAVAGDLIVSTNSPGYNATTINSSLECIASLVAGTCYYIMIDNWPGPNGFAYDISIYDSPINADCSNIGFESGTSGWTATTGIVTKGKNSDPHLFYEPTSYLVDANQHKLVTAANGNDPVIGAAIPQLCPWGGSQSLRLGDGSTAGAKGATIEQRFSVSSTNAMFNYYYAVVLEDPSGHTLQEKPMFKIDVLDCDGNPLTCGEYLVVSSATGFVAFNNGYGTGYYKTWTPVFLDLTSYIGSCVTVRFKTADCTQTGHFGYAYIDATCAPLEVEGPDTVCLGASNTLSAPDGAASYSWTVQGNATVIGTSQDLIISPTVNTTYECVITSVTGCQSTLIQPVIVVTGPTVDDITDQIVCGSYTLPTITGTNLTGNENFHNNSQVNGGVIISGPITSTQTVWIADSIGSCLSEESVLITVNTTPIITNPGNQVVCDSYTLPTITGANLTGNEAYYNDSQANGGTIITGTLTTSQTVWIYDADGSCSDEESFLVTINTTPTITNPGNQLECDSYTLPVISGINLSGSEAYYNDSQTNGGAIITGPITTTQTVWIYDADGSCSDEERFLVTIDLTPSINNPGNQTECDSYTLPVISGTNLSGAEAYYNNSQANGGTIITGPITSTQTIWIYDVNGSCSDEISFNVNINISPVITNNPGALSVCAPYNLPTITGTNLSGSENYFDDSQINGGNILTGPLTTSQTVWIYDINNGCFDEQSYSVTVSSTPPTINNPGAIEACTSYTLPTITGTNLTGNQLYYDDSQANGGNVINGNITSTQTVWIFDQQGTCSDEESFLITISPLPTASISGTIEVCEGSTNPDITFTGANGTAPYTFTYNINGGANTTVISAGNTALVNVDASSTGSFTYNLVSVSDASTASCSQNQSGSATVTINPLPTATISGTTDVCVGTLNSSITFTGANGTSPYSFTYNINGGTNATVVSTGNTAIVNVDASNTGVFTYNLISVSDASSTTCTQSQTSSATITVNPLPTATISGTTEICVGATNPDITFTGANGTAPYTFTYNINGGANTTVTSTGNSALVNVDASSAGIFTYNLVSVSDASSTACSQNQSGSAIITVNPTPTASITGTTDVCVGSSNPDITYTGANGTAPYTFTYNINGGANTTVTSTGNSVLVNVDASSAGVFTYNLISVSDASNTACSQNQSGSAIVTVNTLPTATISGTIELCEGATNPNITFTGANGIAPYTYTYNINGGANTTVTSTGNSALVNVDASSAGIFTYNLISVADASNTACSQNQSGSAIVTVNPLPTATISGTIELCEGATNPNITFTGANGNAPYTFTYNINGGANTTVTSTGNSVLVNVDASSAGVFTYNLISVSDASNTACSQNQSGSAIVTVNPLPIATISGTIELCEGTTNPDITFTGANGTAPYTFTYNINGGANTTVTSTGNSVLVNVDASSAGVLTYNLISVSDASNTACSQNQSGSATVTINPNPIVNFTADKLEGCVPITVNFSNTTDLISDNVTWDFGDGLIENSSTNVNGFSHSFNQVGCFDITLTSTSNNCTSSFNQNQIICTFPNAVADFEIDENTKKSLINPKFIFTNTSSNANVYFWDFDDGNFSNDFNVEHIYDKTITNYIVSLIANNDNNCPDTTFKAIAVLDELIYYVPNTFTPNGDDFNNTFKAVFYSGYQEDDFQMLIFNRWGQLIFESHDSSKGWNGRYGVDGELCSDGMYIWKIHFKETNIDKEHIITGHVLLTK
jgi:gliding motility-associated-like protein